MWGGGGVTLIQTKQNRAAREQEQVQTKKKTGTTP